MARNSSIFFGIALGWLIPAVMLDLILAGPPLIALIIGWACLKSEEKNEKNRK